MTGPPFQPARPVRLYQNIVEQIEGAIVRGEIKPGERLPSERELVTLFGASRPTVREALRVLEAGGIVRSRPGDPNGPEVLPFSTGGLAKEMTRLAQLQELSIAELICFRMIVDGSASLLAARLHTAAELAAMETTIATMARSIERGYDEFSAADVAFHDTIVRASHNTMIQICHTVVRGVVLELVADKVTRAPDSTALMQESLQHHRDVLDAISRGAGHEAARISRQNLYDYYAGYVPEDERVTMHTLLESE